MISYRKSIQTITLQFYFSQNEEWTKTSILSPIPRLANEYQNFGTFSQNRDQYGQIEPINNRCRNFENNREESRRAKENASAIMEHLKSQTEYSYQDHDNIVFNNKKNAKHSRRGKSNNIKSHSSSSDIESDVDEEQEWGSKDSDNDSRSKKRSDYTKLKKILKNTKSSLNKTKNMLEIQKLKNENQEEKLRSLAMEVENLKRHSLENMLVTKSMQSIALNHGLMNQPNHFENIAYITHRNNMEMVN